MLEAISGINVNLRKSKLIGVVGPCNLENLVAVFGCQIETLP